MNSWKITISDNDLQALREHFNSFVKNGLPETKASFVRNARYIHNVWTDYLNNGTSLPGVAQLDKVTKDMVDSVKIDESLNGQTKLRVYSNNRQLAEKQNGSPEVKYDMKKTHPYGKQSRVGENGPYLIIPFRWGTPNDKGTARRWNNFIPQKQYRTRIVGMEMSERSPDINGNWTHGEKNYNGDMIQRSNYTWRDRLNKSESWADENTGKHISAGMVRMLDEATNKSTYFTFRVISVNSPKDSWWYHKKAKPGVDFMGALKNFVYKDVTEDIKRALESDLGAL